MGMTKTRRVVFALIAIALSAGLVLAAALLVDVYLHWRVQRYAGVNVWGYRGPAIGRKTAGERRIVSRRWQYGPRVRGQRGRLDSRAT